MPRPSSTAWTMEAKLSSRSTMSALSFATSVPGIPLHTPRPPACEGARPRREDSPLPRDGHRRELVVSRDHDDLDPRARALLDRLDRVEAGRVHHPGEAEEREA